jgi:hypothetical protein
MTAAFSARDVDAAAYATFGYLTAVVKDVEIFWDTHIKLDAGCKLIDNSKLLKRFQHQLETQAVAALRSTSVLKPLLDALVCSSELDPNGDAVLTTAKTIVDGAAQLAGIAALGILTVAHHALAEPAAAWIAWLREADIPPEATAPEFELMTHCRAGSECIDEVPKEVLTELAMTDASFIAEHPGLAALFDQIDSLFSRISEDFIPEYPRFGCAARLFGILGKACAKPESLLRQELSALIAAAHGTVMSNKLKKLVYIVVHDDTTDQPDHTAVWGFDLVFPDGWATADTAVAPAALKPGYTMVQQLHSIGKIGKKLLRMSHGVAIKIPERVSNGFLNMQDILYWTKEALWDNSDAVASLYKPLVKALKLKDLELVLYTKDLYDKQSTNHDTSTSEHDAHVTKAPKRHVA